MECIISVINLFCRSKIGPKIHFGGMTFFERLLENHNNSFMYVFDENFSNEMEVIPEEYNRDSDMLTESLGEYILAINVERSC